MLDYLVAGRGTMVHAIQMLIFNEPCLYTSPLKNRQSISDLIVTTFTSANLHASI